jgi:hypothetical protein
VTPQNLDQFRNRPYFFGSGSLVCTGFVSAVSGGAYYGLVPGQMYANGVYGGYRPEYIPYYPSIYYH